MGIMSHMTRHEFDAFAENYSELLDESIIFSGVDSAYFSEYKIRDLQRELFSKGIDNSSGFILLDFGCGVGASMPFLRKYF